MFVSLFSCSGNSEADIMFDDIDNLVNENSDSALLLLDSLESVSCKYSYRQRMRLELLRAKAMNKSYVSFVTDSVMKEVVEYYNNNGTASERVEAYYLLGCAYRDIHELPTALKCYYEAVECADTTSKDCDYNQLMRVYGQIAMAFEDQLMPDEVLDALVQYRYCAKKCNNRFEEANGLLLMISPYMIKNDSDKIADVFHEAQVICQKYGYKQLIARYYPYFISDNIAKGNYHIAKELMHEYETESGYFDANGNIKEGGEQYYYSKGQYYLGLEVDDSAEYYFRNLIHSGYQYEGAKGLLDLFSKKKIVDSVCYYSGLYTTATDERLLDMHSDAMVQVTSMYNYSRNENIAIRNKNIAYKNKIIAIVIFIIAIIVIVIFSENYRRYKNKKRQELSRLSSEYVRTKQNYDNAILEQELLHKDISQLKASKKEEIDALNKKLRDIAIQYSQLNSEEREDAVVNNDVVLHFHQMLLPQNVMSYKANKRDWKRLISVIKNCAPEYYYELTNKDLLTELELMAAALTFLKFRPCDIVILLGITSQHLNNLKVSVNKKLFSTEGARSLSKNLSVLFTKVYFSK